MLTGPPANLTTGFTNFIHIHHTLLPCIKLQGWRLLLRYFLCLFFLKLKWFCRSTLSIRSSSHVSKRLCRAERTPESHSDWNCCKLWTFSSISWYLAKETHKPDAGYKVVACRTLRKLRTLYHLLCYILKGWCRHFLCYMGQDPASFNIFKREPPLFNSNS